MIEHKLLVRTEDLVVFFKVLNEAHQAVVGAYYYTIYYDSALDSHESMSGSSVAGFYLVATVA